MMMNMTWKIGVNSQARRLIGSAPGCAGWRGGCGVGETCGAPDTPDAPGLGRGRARDHDQDDQQQERDRADLVPAGAADRHVLRPR